MPDTSSTVAVDPRLPKPLRGVVWFARDYAARHRHNGNRALHTVGVPLSPFGTLYLLAAGRPGPALRDLRRRLPAAVVGPSPRGQRGRRVDPAQDDRGEAPMSAPQNVLVTGATGCLGRHLVERAGRVRRHRARPGARVQRHGAPRGARRRGPARLARRGRRPRARRARHRHRLPRRRHGRRRSDRHQRRAVARAAPHERGRQRAARTRGGRGRRPALRVRQLAADLRLRQPVALARGRPAHARRPLRPQQDARPRRRCWPSGARPAWRSSTSARASSTATTTATYCRGSSSRRASAVPRSSGRRRCATSSTWAIACRPCCWPPSVRSPASPTTSPAARSSAWARSSPRSARRSATTSASSSCRPRSSYGAAAALEAGTRLVGGKPPISRAQLRWYLNDHSFSIAKAKRELGYRPALQALRGAAGDPARPLRRAGRADHGPAARPTSCACTSGACAPRTGARSPPRSRTRSVRRSRRCCGSCAPTRRPPTAPRTASSGSRASASSRTPCP